MSENADQFEDREDDELEPVKNDHDDESYVADEGERDEALSED